MSALTFVQKIVKAMLSQKAKKSLNDIDHCARKFLDVLKMAKLLDPGCCARFLFYLAKVARDF